MKSRLPLIEIIKEGKIPVFYVRNPLGGAYIGTGGDLVLLTYPYADNTSWLDEKTFNEFIWFVDLLPGTIVDDEVL